MLILIGGRILLTNLNFQSRNAKITRFWNRVEYLDIKFFYPNVDLPKTFEMPADVLKARQEKRRVNALAKDAIYIDRSVYPMRYFYLEGDKLRVLQGRNEVTTKTIALKYGRRAIDAKGLKLGHPFLELPPEVAEQFETVIKAQELKNVKLVLAGTSVLDGKEYHRLTVPLPAEQWDVVKTHFVFFEGNDELQGWLTVEYEKVIDILNVEMALIFLSVGKHTIN